MSRDTPIEPERRVVTVLYADIVGSTNIISNLDPDDAADFLDPAINKIIRSIHNFGGTVARVQGDGVKAVFGATQTQEDHALRAAMAGLEMVEALKTAPLIPGIPRARLRVGMHSGFVIVRWQRNDMGGGLDTVGSTAHVAAKIEQVVSADHVAMSETTAGLIHGNAELKLLEGTNISQDDTDLKVFEIKSITSPHETFRNLRFDLHPLIGRESELKYLKSLFDTDLQNQKSSTCIIGEAGIGKSKLIREASLHAIQKNIRVELVGGVSVYKDTPFYVLKSLASKLLRVKDKNVEKSNLQHVSDLALSDRERIGLEKLISSDQGSVAKWDIPVDDKRRAIQTAISAVVAKAASNSPLVLLVEDLHAVDLESAQCLKHIVTQCAPLSLSVVLTSRPQAAELATSILKSKMVLAPLSVADSNLLLRHELGVNDGHELAHETNIIIDDILQRADGLPLALHEYSKLMKARRTAGNALNQMPLALEPLLHQKFDALSLQTGDFVQFASALGNRLNRIQLRKVLNWSPEDFSSAMTESIDKSILIQLEDDVLVFNHHMYQEICYDSMVRSRKREIHQQIYSALSESDNSGMSSAESHGPQILAHHAQESGNLNLALDHLWQACSQAIATAAIRTAQSLYHRAAFVCDQIGEEAATRKIKFASLVFDALHQLAAHQDVLEAFQSARTLNFRGLSKNEEVLIRANIASIQWISGVPDEAYQEAKTAFAAADKIDQLPLRAFASFALANVEHSRGHIRTSVKRLTKVSNEFIGKFAAIRFGQTITLPGVMLRVFASWYAVDLGDLLLAEKFENEARKIAEQENHGYSKTLCDLALGYKFYRTDVFDQAAHILARAHKDCMAESFFGISPFASGWAGASLIANGQIERADEVINRELDLDHVSSIGHSGRYYLYSSQAKLLALNGKLDSAFKALQKALKGTIDTKDPVSEAYARLDKADLLLQMKKQNREIELEVKTALKLATQCEMEFLIKKCQERLAN